MARSHIPFTIILAQLWSEDPHEYIRKGYDIMEDMYVNDRAPSHLVLELQLQ